MLPFGKSNTRRHRFDIFRRTEENKQNASEEETHASAILQTTSSSAQEKLMNGKNSISSVKYIVSPHFEMQNETTAKNNSKNNGSKC